MQATLERQNQKTDWLKAKMAYLHDNTLSYADIAQHFNVSKRQVQRRATAEDWIGCRQDVTENVESIITAQIVDERVEANEKHQKQYAAVQAYIRTYMIVINNWNQKIIDEAQSKGGVPDPHKMYSTKNLYSLVKTLRLAIEGERVTLDLPNVIVKLEDN